MSSNPHKMVEAALVMSDGTLVRRRSVRGATPQAGVASGEVVFNTVLSLAIKKSSPTRRMPVRS